MKQMNTKIDIFQKNIDRIDNKSDKVEELWMIRNEFSNYVLKDEYRLLETKIKELKSAVNDINTSNNDKINKSNNDIIEYVNRKFNNIPNKDFIQTFLNDAKETIKSDVKNATQESLAEVKESIDLLPYVQRHENSINKIEEIIRSGTINQYSKVNSDDDTLISTKSVKCLSCGNTKDREFKNISSNDTSRVYKTYNINKSSNNQSNNNTHLEKNVSVTSYEKLNEKRMTFEDINQSIRDIKKDVSKLSNYTHSQIINKQQINIEDSFDIRMTDSIYSQNQIQKQINSIDFSKGVQMGQNVNILVNTRPKSARNTVYKSSNLLTKKSPNDQLLDTNLKSIKETLMNSNNKVINTYNNVNVEKKINDNKYGTVKFKN